MRTATNRESWVDFAKGLGILLVFFGHGKMYLGAWTVYIVHMPLFFFLSGYLFRGNTGKPGEFILKKVKGLLIPYYVLGIFMFIAVVWHDYLGANKNFRALGLYYFPDLIKSYLTQNRFGTLWYIGTLFWMNLVMLLLVTILKDKLKAMVIVTIVMAAIAFIYYKMGGGALPFNLDIIFAMMFFFVLGYVMKQTGFVAGPKIQKNPMKKWVLFMLISAALGWANIGITGQNVDIYWNSYGFMPLMFVAAIIGIIAIVCFSQKVQWEPVKKLGQYSILFYAFHQCMVFMPIEQYCYRHLLMVNGHETLFQRFAFTAIVMALSLVIFTFVTLFVRKLKFRWIFGVK